MCCSSIVWWIVRWWVNWVMRFRKPRRERLGGFWEVVQAVSRMVQVRRKLECCMREEG